MPLCTKLVVQDPPDASSVSTNPYHTIVFKHPGYQNDNNRLLTLPAYDDPKGGFDIETAKTICGILAGNHWDGFFTQDQHGPPVHVLEASAEYDFILPEPTGDRDTTYPVVPAFSEWKFPHNNLPPSQPRGIPYLPSTTNSNITTALGLREAFKCQISTCEEGYEYRIPYTPRPRATSQEHYTPLRTMIVDLANETSESEKIVTSLNKS